MLDVKQHILQVATERMHQVGIRSVSVDDIIHTLSISKKTFYVYFSTKDELIAAILEQHARTIHRILVDATRNKAILDILVDTLQIVQRTEGLMKPPMLLYDLRKYYPDLLARSQHETRQLLQDFLSDLLHRGIDEGLFRSDLDVDVVVLFFSELHGHLMDALERNEESRDTLLRVTRQGMDILMRGIITPHGADLVRTKMQAKQKPKGAEE